MPPIYPSQIPPDVASVRSRELFDRKIALRWAKGAWILSSIISDGKGRLFSLGRSRAKVPI